MFEGDLDENVQLEPLAQELVEETVPALAIDTNGVRRINSVGVGEWVRFIRALATIPQLTLARCSPAIVAQLNTISNFRGAARVESVAAPFYCNECDEEQLEIIATHGPADNLEALVAGSYSCKHCGSSDLQFDDLPERYFKFLLPNI